MNDTKEDFVHLLNCFRRWLWHSSRHMRFICNFLFRRRIRTQRSWRKSWKTMCPRLNCVSSVMTVKKKWLREISFHDRLTLLPTVSWDLKLHDSPLFIDFVGRLNCSVVEPGFHCPFKREDLDNKRNPLFSLEESSSSSEPNMHSELISWRETKVTPLLERASSSADKAWCNPDACLYDPSQQIRI